MPLDRVEQASDHVLRVFGSHDRLEGLEDERSLLDAHLALVEASHLEQTLVCGDGGLLLRETLLLLDEGLGSRIGLDLHTARLLPLLNGHRSLREALAERAAEMGLGEEDAARFADAGLPALRRLFELGFLAHVPRNQELGPRTAGCGSNTPTTRGVEASAPARPAISLRWSPQRPPTGALGVQEGPRSRHPRGLGLVGSLKSLLHKPAFGQRSGRNRDKRAGQRVVLRRGAPHFLFAQHLVKGSQIPAAFMPPTRTRE